MNQRSGYAEELCQFSFLFAIRPTADGRLSFDGLFWTVLVAMHGARRRR